jgi:acyl dehydratase
MTNLTLVSGFGRTEYAPRFPACDKQAHRFDKGPSVADFSEFIGLPTSKGTLVVERAPVALFARAVGDESDIYQNAEVAHGAGFDGIPAPPTYGFSIQNWGKWAELQPADATPERDPMAELMGGLLSKGGMVLHGEQEFTYHRPLVVGQRLTYEGIVRDVYQKPTGDRVMTFMVVEDTYRDEAGEPVLTSTMNLIHRS